MGNGFLPGEILFLYVDELRDKNRIAEKSWSPSLDDYDSGLFDTNTNRIVEEYFTETNPLYDNWNEGWELWD